MTSQADKGRSFRALHERNKLFVIPNPWDGASAKLLASQGFEALTLQKNLDALRYAARTLRAPYRLPGGPDVRDIVVTGVTEGATGWIASLQATIDDTRYSTDNGTETTFAISGARAWIDGLPWQPATDATALAASDGAFDEKTEQVEGTLDLKGIAPGRHLLYVQGINVRGGGAGTAGTPNAVFEVDPRALRDATRAIVMAVR